MVNDSAPAPVEKKERTKSRDMGKKMGGGKKGIWGKKSSTEILTAPKLDRGDPNYDSENDADVVFESSQYLTNGHSGPAPKFDLVEAKKKMADILSEYFVSAETSEAARSLEELQSQAFHYVFVKRAITMALDKHEHECEMTSRLLSELYPKTLTTPQIAKGFERLLESSADLELDIPNVRTKLATFLARAVVDEILPPKFLMDSFVANIDPEVIEIAKKKLSIKHGTARLEKGWGPGDGRPVEELKQAVDQLFQEYLLSSDVKEANRCVLELNAKHFHHEVVKRAIQNAVEQGEEQVVQMSALLAELQVEDTISQQMIIQGFNRVKENLKDMTLDTPKAPVLVTMMVENAKRDGVLPADYTL